MQIELFVEPDAQIPSRFRGYITLRSGKNSMTVATDNRSQSANGAWDEIITKMHRAIEDAELRAAGKTGADV